MLHAVILDRCYALEAAKALTAEGKGLSRTAEVTEAALRFP